MDQKFHSLQITPRQQLINKKSVRQSFKDSDLTVMKSLSKDGQSPLRAPGDYQLPPLLGKEKIQSMQFNDPKFSFGSRLNTKQVLSGKHVQDYLLKESPGVGSYDPDMKDHKKGSPSFSWGNQKRFRAQDYHLTRSSKIPHNYANLQNVLTIAKEAGPISAPQFGTAKRRSNHKIQAHYTPSPLAYDLSYHKSIVNNIKPLKNIQEKSKRGKNLDSPYSIETDMRQNVRYKSVNLRSPRNLNRNTNYSVNLSKQNNSMLVDYQNSLTESIEDKKLLSQMNATSMTSIQIIEEAGVLPSNMRGPTFGLQHNKKVFTKGFGNQFLSKQTPGPGNYQNISKKSRFSKNMGIDTTKFSFGKCDRGLNNMNNKNKSKSPSPGPVLYKSSVKLVRKQAPKFKIPSAERTIDVRKYAGLNSYMWSKGLS